MGKHIFVLGGVLSSLGKGIASASVGFLLNRMGYSIAMQKLDPYLNVCIGAMSPFQHGEVFVTEDGGEGDLDLGHYERFTSISTSKADNATSGVIYEKVIQKEKNGEYLGGTVQVIPHITDEIKAMFSNTSKGKDFTITEIGGTIGDIESLPFIEAIRQYRLEMGFQETMIIFLTYIPYIKVAEEVKTKPTQHAVNKLRELGIQPDLILCRTEVSFDEHIKRKIALFTNVSHTHVKQAIDAKSVYEIPKNYLKEGVHELICDHFSMEIRQVDLSIWDKFLINLQNSKNEVNVAICGKFIHHKDAYISIAESLKHAAAWSNLKVVIHNIDSEKNYSPEDLKNLFLNINGILLPSGSGERGLDGMIRIAKYARTNNIPLLSIGLGMQVVVIEFAHNVCKIEDAYSTEIDRNCLNPVIDFLLDSNKEHKRLGAYDCLIKEKTLAAKIYEEKKISERHRHTHGVKHNYWDTIEKHGMMISGTSEDGSIVEIVEIPSHPFYIGVQFLPEYKSRPDNPHRLFRAFICAVNKKKETQSKDIEQSEVK